jgi:hypothetical protein
VLVHLGATELEGGPTDVRLVADTGNVNVDWTFLRRAAECP